jgi:hypothetical protein
MTDVALLSRNDFGTPGSAPKTYRQIAGATQGREEPDTAINTALRTLTTYIPTEVLTLYVAVVAALGSGTAATTPNHDAVWVTFWAFVVATPIAVLLVFLAKVKAGKKAIPLNPVKWPLWEMIAATIAYVAWAFALPGSPFGEFTVWYSPAVAGIAVLVTSTVLGLFAPLFARPLKS